MSSTLQRSIDLLNALRQTYKDKDFMFQVLSNALYYQRGVEFRENCTQDAWDTGLPAGNLVSEHPWGRNRSIRILAEIAQTDSDITPEEFDVHVQTFLKYQITTKQENEDLKKYYESHPNAHPDEAYEAVCSPLREWVNVRDR